MASDVEVLREIHRRMSAGGDPTKAVRWPDADAALSAAISALEAREAQPKVEGRPDDAEWAAIVKDQRMSPSFPTNEAIRREAARARASEAALSKRVEELERLIRMDYRGEHPYHAQGPCLCLQCEIARERRRLGFPG